MRRVGQVWRSEPGSLKVREERVGREVTFNVVRRPPRNRARGKVGLQKFTSRIRLLVALTVEEETHRNERGLFTRHRTPAPFRRDQEKARPAALRCRCRGKGSMPS